MPIDYNRMAGTSIERLAALSDGIFAVAMTLLVLELKTPARELIHSNADLLGALFALVPEFLTYVLSVLTLGIFWVGQQAQLNAITRGDRNFTWLNLAFLTAASLIPFSTRLLADFFTLHIAILGYWLNILTLGFLLYATWRYAHAAGLLREDTTDEVRCAIERRILIGQALYAAGALTSIIDNRVAIGFIFCVQLWFVLGRSRWSGAR